MNIIYNLPFLTIYMKVKKCLSACLALIRVNILRMSYNYGTLKEISLHYCVWGKIVRSVLNYVNFFSYMKINKYR